MSLGVKHIQSAAPKHMGEELRGGLSYVRHQGSMLALTVLAFPTTFLGFAILTFLPLFAQRVFHQGVGEYSRLMASSGAGAVCGALAVAWLGKHSRLGLAALVVQLTYRLLIVGFAFSRILWLSDILLFFTGAHLIIVFSTIASTVPLNSPNQLPRPIM